MMAHQMCSAVSISGRDRVQDPGMLVFGAGGAAIGAEETHDQGRSGDQFPHGLVEDGVAVGVGEFNMKLS